MLRQHKREQSMHGGQTVVGPHRAELQACATESITTCMLANCRQKDASRCQKIPTATAPMCQSMFVDVATWLCPLATAVPAILRLSVADADRRPRRTSAHGYGYPNDDVERLHGIASPPSTHPRRALS